jgi:hypothetical protein
VVQNSFLLGGWESDHRLEDFSESEHNFLGTGGCSGSASVCAASQIIR